MKASRTSVAAAILAAIMVIVSMAINVYNAYYYNISGSRALAISERAFFGWWAVSFISVFLLYAVSQSMYRENKRGKVFANWLAGIVTVLAVSLVVF